VAGRQSTRAALVAICGFVVLVGAWNVFKYPPGLGYDYTDHESYADNLVPGWHLPHGVGEYYQPPGFYFVAGSLDWVASKLGVGDPHRAGMALDVLFLLGTVLLTWKIARELWPERPRIAIAAVAFVALLPRTVEMAAMFQPSTMALFLCTLALWLCVRTFADRRYAIALGVALGLAQLVLAASLWMVAAACIALLAGGRRRAFVIALALAIVIPLPWYIHQQLTYSGLAPFPRPATPAARHGDTESGKPKPLYDRRPFRFYVDPGLPDVITHPYREHFRNLAWPTTYSELWGDYFGHWNWNARDGTVVPSSSVRRQLSIQSLVGILPTVLAVVGWLALLFRSRRRPSWLAVSLLPLFGLLGYAYFVVSYPTPDGDVLKASYMLVTAGAWAIGFAYALDRLRGRAFWAVVALLAIGALAELPFIVY
jgi:4-amino-4-deoxy-L-arabinose transferase-like glycosyltransferase